MNRIEKKFKLLRKNKRAALITFITAGDPDLSATVKLAKAMEEAGADMVELGVPFSDPLADGAAIQAASARALKKGVTLLKIFKAAGKIRKQSEIPLVLMTYVNPVNRFGEEAFFKECRRQGVDGVIIPDIIPEEAGGMIRSSRQNGINLIFLAAPTSSDERLKMIAGRTRGFLYYVTLTGTTGERKAVAGGLKERIMKLKKMSAVPVACGFGISTPGQAKEIAKYADGIIVGSAIVKIIEKYGKSRKVYAKVSEFVSRLKGHSAPKSTVNPAK